MQPIEHVVTAEVSTPDHTGGRLVVWIRHLPDDPLAVRLDFAPTGGPEQSAATWVFARSLLAEGIITPVGDGDVRVRPGDAYETHIELRPVHGHCLVRFRTAALRSFLARTETWPPQVSARVRTELDRTLDAILRRA
ncbi:SsgA family sporulation/cell division regulator [Streptomyces parvus]|uniref:SsgA family sporulation/cell division regulator n=1 Tax=Streptomyces parvus TaxID=66428 RepID=UPI0016538272|nr:SsgA family sporulation/cell division regulator [Streptomyces parvus]